MTSDQGEYVGTRMIGGRIRHVYYAPHDDREYYIVSGERVYLAATESPEYVGGEYTEHSRRD